MSYNDEIELKGKVTKALKGGKFMVDANINDIVTSIECTVCGKLRQNYIKILVGDMVDIVISPYDLKKGRIKWRYK